MDEGPCILAWPQTFCRRSGWMAAWSMEDDSGEGWPAFCNHYKTNPSIPGWTSKRLGRRIWQCNNLLYLWESEYGRLSAPHFLNCTIRHRTIIHEPMLEWIEIRRYLATGLIEQVTCGGESGPEARICDYAWILEIMQQCVEYDIPFWFKQTGAKFKKETVSIILSGKTRCTKRKRLGWITDTKEIIK